MPSEIRKIKISEVMVENNIRVVVIDISYKKIVRAEMQVRLCEEYWTPVKTIAKGESKSKVMKSAEQEIVKLKFRATIDSAIRLDETIREFENKGDGRE